jgi:hypothetical protein
MRSPAEPDARTEVALDEAYECLRAIRQRGCLEPDEEYEDAAERAHALIALLFNPTISEDVRDWWLRLADQPGPSRKGRSAKRRRDFWITHVIELLVDKYDLTPTRSRGSKYQQQLTACAIVARALSKLGITLAESAVEAICRHYLVEARQAARLVLSVSEDREIHGNAALARTVKTPTCSG